MHNMSVPPQPFSNQMRWVLSLYQLLLAEFTRLEATLSKRKANPARLPLPSYRAFAWVRFLAKKENFLDHLNAMQEFIRLARDIPVTNRKITLFGQPHVQISIYYIPYIYRTHFHARQVELTINECLIRAPLGMKKQILQAALTNDRNSVRMVKNYCTSPAYQRVDLIIRGSRHGHGSSPKGDHINLEHVFARVNKAYFHNQLEKPQLSWSQKRSRRRLGSYSAQTDTVIITRSFDQLGIPDYVIDFIMYHELLHEKLGVKQANSGGHNHNKRFKDLERQFPYYEDANKWLKQKGL